MFWKEPNIPRVITQIELECSEVDNSNIQLAIYISGKRLIDYGA